MVSTLKSPRSILPPKQPDFAKETSCSEASRDLQGKSFLALLEPSARVRRDFRVEGPGPVNLGNVRDKSHDGAGTVGPDGNFYFVSGSALCWFSRLTATS
jgi:hypothetical protein